MTYSRMAAPALLAALFYLFTPAAAAAQTISVTRAGAGSSVEIVFDGTKIGSAIADKTGVASVDTNKLSEASQEMSVRLAVDLCKDLVRVQMIDAGVMAPPEAGCTRRDITGLYVMRHITSFVIDVGQPAPSVWVAQGPAPKPWLDPNAPIESAGWAPLPKGLVLSGGAGLASIGNVVTEACGNVTDCSRQKRPWALDAAATVWLTRWLAAEIGLLNPTDVKVSGSGTGFRFTNTVQASVLTIAAKVGATAGPARIYGFGGRSRHWTTSTTTETTDASTVTVDDKTVTVPGGTQTLAFRATGWGWLVGGGVEFWIKHRVAIFAEGARVPLKGQDESGGEGRVDDRVIYIIGGIRIHLLP